MEYERTPAGQIQADFARRAGQLLLQYERIGRDLSPDEQFESTLAVALLQSMLTICLELLNRGSGQRVGTELRDVARLLVLDEPARMGLEPKCVVECWPSTRGLTYREVFECLRHALSHPCPQGGTTYPVTGYTTVAQASGHIELFEFVQSSWVNGKGSGLSPTYAPGKTDDAAKTKAEECVRRWASNASVEGLELRKNADGKWRVYLGDSLFVPVLRIRLTVQQLRTLTLTLSDLLSSSLEPTSAVPA